MALAVFAGLVLLGVLVVSPQALLDYPAHLLGVAGEDALGVHVDEMVNWRGVAERLGLGGWFVIAATVATLAAVAYAWWRNRSLAMGAAIAFLATPLVIPHANQHEAILAELGVVLAIAALPAMRTAAGDRGHRHAGRAVDRSGAAGTVRRGIGLAGVRGDCGCGSSWLPGLRGRQKALTVRTN